MTIEDFSFDVRGSILVCIFIVDWAFEGRKERKRRAVFARRLKGLKVVFTLVMKRLIIFGNSGGLEMVWCVGVWSNVLLETGQVSID